MKISRHWLNQYVQTSLSDEQLSHRLTMAGLEVESVESPAEKMKGIVVGEVREVRNHPNADSLSICSVSDGKLTQQVVCGAPNVAAGQRVAFASVGTVVPRNQRDGSPMEIGAITIRGVKSTGMICSGYELGISDDRDGILVLPAGVRPGKPLAAILGLSDSIFDIAVTPNRPDLLSYIGVAREVAAFTGAAQRVEFFTVCGFLCVVESPQRVEERSNEALAGKVFYPEGFELSAAARCCNF